jgi:hypothetical protein
MYAIKQACVNGDAGCIICEELHAHGIVSLIAWGDAKGCTDQATSTRRSKRSQQVKGSWLQPAVKTHFIDGGCEIGGGISERAIQIKQQRFGRGQI